jgi:cysteine-rich repeat protein
VADAGWFTLRAMVLKTGWIGAVCVALVGCFNPGGSGSTAESTDETGTTAAATSTSSTPTSSTGTSTSGPGTTGTSEVTTSTTTTTDPTTTTGGVEGTTTEETGTTVEPGTTKGETTDGTTTSETTASSTEMTTETTATTQSDGFCGDGSIGAMEKCDDGNMTDGDGCNATCERDALYVFVTSGQFGGSLGGLDGADQRCRDAAASISGVPAVADNFVAWLSTMNMSAYMRLIPSQLPYKRLGDFATVASGTGAFVDDMVLEAAISYDELGQSLGTETQCADEMIWVWTGTNVDGTPATNHCVNWVSFAMAGQIGLATAATAQWTSGCGAPSCGKLARLYCVENP